MEKMARFRCSASASLNWGRGASIFHFKYSVQDCRSRVPSIIFGFFAGAHMNPAVTLAFAVVRRIPWRKVPVYWTAQMLGAFVASACVYAVYYGESNANSHTE